MRARLNLAVAFAAALVTSAAASYPALSADLLNTAPPPPAYMPPPPPANLFAGWWIGGTGAAAFANYDFSLGRDRINTSGAMGGGIAGWNWQSGRIVLGVEGDILGGDVSGSRRFDGGANIARPDIDAMADLRLRAGVTIMPQLLLFATGGGSWADADLPVAGIGGGSRSDSFWGWSVGGGAEVALNPNWHARFDYQFTDFDAETVHYPGGEVSYNPDMSTYRGSLIYQF